MIRSISIITSLGIIPKNIIFQINDHIRTIKIKARTQLKKKKQDLK